MRPGDLRDRAVAGQGLLDDTTFLLGRATPIFARSPGCCEFSDCVHDSLYGHSDICAPGKHGVRVAVRLYGHKRTVTVVTAETYLNDDYRQLLIAVEMTEFFERRAVDAAKSVCPNSKYRIATSPGDVDQFRTSGKDALSSQMARYFEIRDFVIPAIAALKARLSIAARKQAGQDIPNDLLQRANSLTDLLNQERSYTYKPPTSPFATARVKERITRDFKETGTSLDPIDDLVWNQTAEEAMIEGLRGHGADVEYLISCGFLKPGARVLETASDAKASS